MLHLSDDKFVNHKSHITFSLTNTSYQEAVAFFGVVLGFSQILSKKKETSLAARL